MAITIGLAGCAHLAVMELIPNRFVHYFAHPKRDRIHTNRDPATEKKYHSPNDTNT
jgi:hypothetical protein